MIRALLEGRKTQTRRLAWRDGPKDEGGVVAVREAKPSLWQKVKPGELFWVKETFAQEHPLAVQEGRYSQEGRAGIPGPPPINYRVIYRADGEPLQVWRVHDGHPYFSLSGPADEVDAKFPTVASNFTRLGKAIHWASPLHMPRWASRLTLEIAAVRLQHLQEINETDAIAEGIGWSAMSEGYSSEPDDGGPHYHASDPTRSFESLFCWLHGDEVWNANPEVVALTFTVHKINIDTFLRQREAA
ncbi:MAG: hypothetical protein A3E01_10035 [Gammaproteobacteria bacterium RIFCSPHIGHO2_12_FULL_63_22]|nr:MAG: hypothetical protein A3E01_10035 [Gammaproteobacteria bacterium RIFCSPHIGHO2_12_FULL_63_22]